MADGASRALLGTDGESPGSYSSWVVLGTYLGGGTVLCGSYVWGIAVLMRQYGTAMSLWGHLSDPGWAWLRYGYYVSMTVSAIGFFPSLVYAVRICRFLPKSKVNAICAWLLAFYISEMFWMPMCVAYINSPSTLMYTLIRIDLAMSGILALAWACSKLAAVPVEVQEAAGCCVRVLGTVGTAIFALHCAVLDAIVWPPFFK
mmetsp:Transcript_86011/g.233082  ORF Transcript_86011/g.233082 Transcript_86011/m.233082 type:complete len:202 (+) Transcript_86011:62-667(+)